MKKIIFTSLGFIINLVVFSNALKTQQSFSPEARELIDEHQPKATPLGFHPPTYPVILQQQYANEKYRLAWEELYRESIMDSNTPIPRHVIFSALTTIASTNSIPMLKEVYNQLLETNKNTNLERQHEILKILFRIDAQDAMDAAFALLDLTETKINTDCVVSLHEMIINDFNRSKKSQEWHDAFLKATPNATINEKTLKDIELTKKMQERFNAYQNPNLSVKNQKLLEITRKKEPAP